jgi:hypothetical protein
VNAANLLTLALLAATLLRDRKIAANTLTQSAAVRLVHGAEVDRMNNEAHREASQWIFKGGTGSHLRAVTLRTCVELAREANRPMRMKIEIIDPTDEQLCRRYAEYRASLRSGSERDHGEAAPRPPLATPSRPFSRSADTGNVLNSARRTSRRLKRYGGCSVC